MYIIRRAFRIDDQLVPNVGVSQALARLRIENSWPGFILARWTGLWTVGHEPWTFRCEPKQILYNGSWKLFMSDQRIVWII
jgi:hypothetical protein